MSTLWEHTLHKNFFLLLFQYFTFLISLLFHYPMKILSWTKGVQVWNQEQPLYLPTSYLVWSLWESFRTCLLSMVDFPRSEKVLLISMENFLNHFQTFPYWTIPNWKVWSTYYLVTDQWIHVHGKFTLQSNFSAFHGIMFHFSSTLWISIYTRFT